MEPFTPNTAADETEGEEAGAASEEEEVAAGAAADATERERNDASATDAEALEEEEGEEPAEEEAGALADQAWNGTKKGEGTEEESWLVLFFLFSDVRCCSRFAELCLSRRPASPGDHPFFPTCLFRP